LLPNFYADLQPEMNTNVLHMTNPLCKQANIAVTV